MYKNCDTSVHLFSNVPEVVCYAIKVRFFPYHNAHECNVTDVRMYNGRTNVVSMGTLFISLWCFLLYYCHVLYSFVLYFEAYYPFSVCSPISIYLSFTLEPLNCAVIIVIHSFLFQSYLSVCFFYKNHYLTTYKKKTLKNCIFGCRKRHVPTEFISIFP